MVLLMTKKTVSVSDGMMLLNRILLCCLICMVGCGGESESFIEQVDRSDRIVVFNCLASNEINRRATVTVTGVDIQTIVNTIKQSKKDNKEYRCVFDICAEFYCGKSKMGSILICGSLFKIGNNQYRDDGGILLRMLSQPVYRAERGEPDETGGTSQSKGSVNR
jgi:hypothetical protein